MEQSIYIIVCMPETITRVKENRKTEGETSFFPLFKYYPVFDHTSINKHFCIKA